MPGGNLVVLGITMVVLLVCSAVFSGSETAFFSLNSLEKDSLRRRTKGGTGLFVRLLFSEPDEVLVTILTGNMFVNIFASSISEAIGAAIFARGAEFFSIVSMTIVLLVVGEMTPKNIAVRHSLRFSIFAAGILRHVHVVLRPVTRPLGRIRHAVISAFPGRPELDESRGDAVLSAIRMGYESKTIDESELKLLERFFRFRDKTAADVMIPRVDCRPVSASTTVREFLAAVSANESDTFSRLIPLYRDDVDHITGYVRLSDLIPFRLGGEPDRPLSELKRPIHAVPDGKDLRELLEEMAELQAEMAVVVDEYGGTEGLVSFAAVMSYLFGDFAAAQNQPIHALDDSSYRIAGYVDLREVESVLQTELPGDSRTLGGFVIDLIDDLPSDGATVEAGGYRFTVERVSGRRIVWVRATRMDGR